MHVLLLILTAGALGFLHSILPDHWVPLAVIARTERWNLLRTARVSWLASTGHVLASIVLSGIVAAVGLQFRHQIEAQQGRIVGGVLVLTVLGFLVWGLTGHGHHHHDDEHGHDHEHGHTHDQPHLHDHDEAHEHDHEHRHSHAGEHTRATTTDEKQPLVKQIGAIAVSFGVAASPDLTVLPVAIAASLVGVGAVIGVLISFTAVTMATFVILTVVATIAGYQVKGEWLEHNATTITAIVLIVIGIVAFIGF